MGCKHANILPHAEKKKKKRMTRKCLVAQFYSSGNPLFKIRFDALMNSVMRFYLDGLALVIA